MRDLPAEEADASARRRRRDAIAAIQTSIAYGGERALRQSAEFDRFGSIKRRFPAYFVADPYTLRTISAPGWRLSVGQKSNESKA